MKNKENTLGANKQMAFLNTTKLAVALKRTLTVLTLCIISALCIQAEESTIEPSDSIAVTGPKKSHWTSGLGIPYVSPTKYHNEHDFAQVKAVVKVYNEDGTTITDEATIASIGKVSLEQVTTDNGAKGTVEDGSPVGNETTSAYINWHCNIPESENNNQTNALVAAHKLHVKLTAALVEGNKDYVFAGWSTNQTYKDYDKGTNTTFEHTSNIANGGSGYGSYASKKNTQYEGSTRYTEIFYAKFVPVTPTKVTLAVAENGTYHYSTSGNSGDIIASADTIESKERVSLTATSKSGYKFFGWYTKKGSQDIYFSYDSVSTSPALTQDTTIYAKFIPSNWATYIVKGEDKRYFEFDKAEAAAASSSKVFLPITDGIVPYKEGGYSIRSGVTLLIPYEETYTVEKDSHNYLEAPAVSGRKVSPYRTLTLDSGVKINVDGDIVVGAQYYSSNGTNPGGVCAKYGFILMNEGSLINLNVSAKLYAWGYISGDGQIIAAGSADGSSGANLYEMFQITDFRGGNATVNKYVWGEGKDKKVFPILSYYMQNIEVPLTLEYGANLSVDYGLYMADNHFTGRNYFIGRNSSAMFNMQSGTIKRWYDRMTDRIHYELNGNCDLKNISITANYLMTYTINSKDYTLPINSNMTINVKSGSKFNLTQDMSFLPCTDITIEKGATLEVNEGLNVYTYDAKDWVGRGCVMTSFDFEQLLHVGRNDKGTYGKPFTRTMTADNPNHDARLKINGELILNGYLYTSSFGANICSDGGGKIIYKKSAGTKTEIWQGKNTEDFQQIPITAAQLHNDERKNPNYHYTQTDKVGAGDVFTYSETYGRWRCERTITWDANGGTIEPTTTVAGREEPLSLYFPESLPTPTKTGYTFMGWFTAASGGDKITIETIVNDNVTYYAQWVLNIVGTPLDIVDADGTYLTINTNGWASTGWPYTINGTEYGKDDKAGKEKYRQADRTLVIPYDGQPNDDMLIEVKDTEGTVVSCHMYKVPFVYNTSNATLSGTDENSENRIVFVKSGTLSIEGTASAKEIYVAPGAALQVNENGTLTVGKLVLRTTPFDAAILTNNGTIAGQVYYSRIARDTDFHLFAIPAGSNTANVVLSDGSSCAENSTTTPYGAAWQLREYNTARRAAEGATGTNWDNIGVNGDGKTYSDVAIEASKGYELRSGSKYYREYLFPITLPTTATEVVVVSATGAAGAAHAGWNILCSPHTGIYTVENYNDPATAIKVCWQQTDGSYIQEQPEQIKPAVPFAYQASKTGILTFDTNLTFVAQAPRKQSAAEALTETEWVHLDIFDAYGDGDKTSLFVHPTRFEQIYKTGIDVAKQSLTAARPIIYSTHAYGDMAFAGIADSLLENGIDLVVYSPAAQELTFSLRENKFLHRLEYLWLADNETGARTNLLMDDYTCRANAGTTKGRFVLNGRFKAPQISTGIGNTQTDYNIYAIGNNIAISGVEQGTPIYVFDAVGHMIYTTAATSDEVIVPAPCAGVYMLTIGGQTAKLVVNQ